MVPDSKIEHFALITRKIIARDGISSFLPTVLFPERDHIAVLEGLPSDADVPAVSRAWAKHLAQPEEPFLLAYRSGADNFAVLYSHSGVEQETHHGVQST